MVEREPPAGAAEPGHDLVQDQHDPVLVAQSADTREVARRWDQHAGRAHDGLHQDRRDRARALEPDDVGEVLERPLRLLLGARGPEVRAVGVGTEEVHVVVGELVGPAPRVAGRDDGRTGVAVVRAVEAQDLAAAGVQAGHPDRVLDGIGATVGEEHLVHARGGQLADQPGGLAAGGVRVLRGDGRQDAGLLLDRSDDLGVLVADVGVDQLAGEVQVPVAVVVPDPGARRAREGHRGQRRLCRPGVEDMRPVELIGTRTGCGIRGGGGLGHAFSLISRRVIHDFSTPRRRRGQSSTATPDPGRPGRVRGLTCAYIALMMSSTRSLASPNSIWVFSLKNSGFCTPA